MTAVVRDENKRRHYRHLVPMNDVKAVIHPIIHLAQVEPDAVTEPGNQPRLAQRAPQRLPRLQPMIMGGGVVPFVQTPAPENTRVG